MKNGITLYITIFKLPELYSGAKIDKVYSNHVSSYLKSRCYIETKPFMPCIDFMVVISSTRLLLRPLLVFTNTMTSENTLRMSFCWVLGYCDSL